MNEDFIKEIRTRGHWRINIRPADEADEQELSLARCMQLVTECGVSLRGWDYPHIPNRNDDTHGISRMDEYVEAWTDWTQHREFWRMYASSQFLHYRALNEQWMDRSPWGEKMPSSWGREINQPVFGVLSNLCLLVEVFEFVARMHGKGLYERGVVVDLQLRSGPNQGPRVLWIEDNSRAPFSYDRENAAPALTYKVRLAPDGIKEVKTQAVRAAVHFYGKFDWVPSEEQLMKDIDKLYSL